LSVEIPEGSVIAVVGTSGVGKSTLIDLMLGILIPDAGSVKISDMSPKDAISNWPGAIAYVPQDVLIADATLKENVLLGFPADVVPDSEVLQILSLLKLENLVSSSPLGLQQKVGERGSKLSGGQKQRLGIARALITRPQILILDEATNALDGETAATVTEILVDLPTKPTVLLIAHNIQTIKATQKILYLKNKNEIILDAFENIQGKHPEFNLCINGDNSNE